MARLLDSEIMEETPPQGANEPQRRLAIGRLGGALFCAGAFLCALSALTLDPLPPVWAFGVMALALGSGITCLRLRWDRLGPGFLHTIPIIATAEITAVVWATGERGDVYAWLYLIVVVTVAYAFRSRRVVAAYVALVSLCVATRLVDPSLGTGDSLRNLLVSAPSLAVAAAVVTYFRERLEAGKNAYQALSRLDPLTGVGNYRALYERLDYEIARHERHGRRLTVMLIDLCCFKQVNDTYGHLEGDLVLRKVGQALAETVRDQDTVARQGGDEFSILAPETDNEEAATLGERLRKALRTVPAGDQVLTASVGWAIYPDHGSTGQELLAHADAALLASKASPLVHERSSPLATGAR